MSTGQTMLTIGAFVLLSNILVTFYRLLAESGQTIDSAQAGITEVSLATSYIQIAQGLHFDEATIDSFVTQSQISHLTAPAHLGRDNNYGVDSMGCTTCEPEDDLVYFDDVDDFNGFTIRDSTLGGTLGNYRASFVVYYVSPTNVDSMVNTQTFIKRLDMKIWREFPPSGDTLRTSMIMGYWLFSNAL